MGVVKEGEGGTLTKSLEGNMKLFFHMVQDEG